MEPSRWRDLRRSFVYLRPHSVTIGIVVTITLVCSGITATEPLVHKAIFDQLAAWITPIAAAEETRKFLANLGYDPWVGDAKVVADMLERESKRWAEYVKIAKVEPQ